MPIFSDLIDLVPTAGEFSITHHPVLSLDRNPFSFEMDIAIEGGYIFYKLSYLFTQVVYT